MVFVEGHPLSVLNAVTLGHLDAFEFIAPGTDTGDWLTFCGLSVVAQRIRESRLVAHNSHALEAMLESGVGITIMPRFAAPKGRVRHLLFRPLTDMDAVRQVFTMRSRERPLSAQGRDFLDMLKVTAIDVGLVSSA